MTKPGYTHIAIVLDRSGSMANIKKDTEGGFATLLADQLTQPGEATLELRQFDTVQEVVHGPLPLASVPVLELRPRGGTALLDAMGLGMVTTGEWLAAMPEDQRPEHVIFAVITDGEENSSKEFTRDQILLMVKEQEDVFGWTFLYLGANQDAIKVGADLGMSKGSTLTYSAATVGSTYSTMSSSVGRTRKGGSGAFTDDERAASSIVT